MRCVFGRCNSGCKLDSREIAATIIPEKNCMVATSLLSNAFGVDDSTSKTPSVRRKCRSGATRIDRTPISRHVAQSTRGFDSVSAHINTSPVRTHSAESPLSVWSASNIGSGTPRSGATYNLIPRRRRNRRTRRPCKSLRLFRNDADARFEVHLRPIDLPLPSGCSTIMVYERWSCLAEAQVMSAGRT